MGKFLSMVGMSIGGWIGWALGERFGFMTAFFLSLVGTAAGLYWTNRWVRDHFG